MKTNCAKNIMWFRQFDIIYFIFLSQIKSNIMISQEQIKDAKNRRDALRRYL